MRTRHLVVITTSLFYFLSFFIHSFEEHSDISTSDSKILTISVVPDITALDWFKQYVLLAYKKIGYRVIFKDLPLERSNDLAKKDQLDAMLVRLSAIEKSIPDFVRVPVVFAKGNINLYCQKGLVCNEDVLNNNENIIGVFAGVNITKQIMENKTANVFEVSSIAAASKMFQKKRLQYLISIDKTDLGYYISDNPDNYEKAFLMEYEAFHYLHNKHTTLLPELTKALDVAVQEVGPMTKVNYDINQD